MRLLGMVAVVTGAEINVPLVIDCGGPNVCLLRVENFRELWREHQYAGVADRNSARVALQQFSATSRLPNNWLTSFYGQNKKSE